MTAGIESSKNAGGYFITTGTCTEYGKSDDCYELNMFRKFRDEWLSRQPDGMKLIDEYYHIAPTIVDLINKQSNRRNIYHYININFLTVCLRFIENCELEKC